MGVRKLDMSSAASERRFDLPQRFPAYVVYLTASANDGRVTIADDPDARDKPADPTSPALQATDALINSSGY